MKTLNSRQTLAVLLCPALSLMGCAGGSYTSPPTNPYAVPGSQVLPPGAYNPSLPGYNAGVNTPVLPPVQAFPSGNYPPANQAAGDIPLGYPLGTDPAAMMQPSLPNSGFSTATGSLPTSQVLPPSAAVYPPQSPASVIPQQPLPNIYTSGVPLKQLYHTKPIFNFGS